jgi:hypothetical protein
MNIEEVQSLCKQLTGVTEDIKWGSDLCFTVCLNGDGEIRGIEKD